MTVDRTTEAIVEAWLDDGFTARPDVETMLGNVRAGVSSTPQHRHRWWPFGRAMRPPVPERGPVPARGFTMFSALKFIAAGVIVALFGGFLVVNITPLPQGEVVIPAQDAAETVEGVSREAAVFDGTMHYPSKLQEGTREPVPEERMTKVRGQVEAGRLEDVSDPRLAGTWQTIMNEDWYGDAVEGVWTTATRIDNAEGSWLGHLTGYHDPREIDSWQHSWHWQGVLTGTGAYEGLSALVLMETNADRGYRVHGIVFPGQLPEFPEYPERAE